MYLQSSKEQIVSLLITSQVQKCFLQSVVVVVTQPPLLPRGAENEEPRALYHKISSSSDGLDLMGSRG